MRAIAPELDPPPSSGKPKDQRTNFHRGLEPLGARLTAFGGPLEKQRLDQDQPDEGEVKRGKHFGEVGQEEPRCSVWDHKTSSLPWAADRAAWRMKVKDGWAGICGEGLRVLSWKQPAAVHSGCCAVWKAIQGWDGSDLAPLCSRLGRDWPETNPITNPGHYPPMFSCPAKDSFIIPPLPLPKMEEVGLGTLFPSPHELRPSWEVLGSC